MLKRSLPWLAAALVVAAGVAMDRQVSLIDEYKLLESEHPAINYWNAEPTDPIARLQAKIDAGEVEFGYHEDMGYLPAVLEALNVLESSQALVFSKTSFQATKIFPRVPRAIYHSEDVTVGWVRGGDVVEVASVDPKLGVVFYTLDQGRGGKPQFRLRTTECISCHMGPATLGVPGLMVRSVLPERSGSPLRTPSYISDHRSPIEERWGGWYVSGLHGGQPHLGNAIYGQDGRPESLTGRSTSNLEDLHGSVNPHAYLRGTSDIVSLMVLEHQTRMINLITRLGYETRIAQFRNPQAAAIDDLPEEAATEIRNTAEELVRYTLFMNEAGLADPIEGTSGFAEAFEQRGVRDSKGRSLWDLNLETRLLEYPCSYLIYSEQFEALPAPAKELVYRRLWETLNAEGREEIVEILRETKEGLPEYW